MTTIINTFNMLTLRAPLQKYFNSIWAFHLIDKMEYWFSHDKFRDSFYKFTEPCQKTKHFYKEGDSWTEVLGISRKLFNKTFDMIGIRYSSETAFKAEADPFKGKLYACYHNRQTHQTFYVRNHNMVQEFLTRLSQENKQNTFFKKKQKQAVIQVAAINSPTSQSIDQQCTTPSIQPINEEDLASIKPSKIVPLQDCGNGTLGHSPTEPKGRSIYIQSNTNKPNSSLNQKTIVKSETIESEEDVKKMVELWQKIVGHGYILSFSQKFFSTLKTVLAQQFNNCLEKWKAYCQKIASSKFLMGEQAGTRFKAWLTWVIEPKTIERIRLNGFSFGDRQMPTNLEYSMTVCQRAEQLVEKQRTAYARDFHRCLLKQGGAVDYCKWFERLTVTIDEQNQIMISADNRFTRDTIRNRFLTIISSAIHQAFGVDQTYEFTFGKI